MIQDPGGFENLQGLFVDGVSKGVHDKLHK